MAVWEKRQMGNVLLIIILVIRNLLAELSPSKVRLTEKKNICWPGWPARFKIIIHHRTRKKQTLLMVYVKSWAQVGVEWVGVEWSGVDFSGV